MQNVHPAFLLIIALATAPIGMTAELPPGNPYLADSSYAMAHGDSAQQDALPQAGPSSPGRTLSEHEIQYVHTGPAFFGILTSGVYEDGTITAYGDADPDDSRSGIVTLREFQLPAEATAENPGLTYTGYPTDPGSNEPPDSTTWYSGTSNPTPAARAITPALSRTNWYESREGPAIRVEA